MSQTISAQEFVNGKLGAMHKLTIGNWQSEVLNSSMNDLLHLLGPQICGNQAGRGHKRRFDYRDAFPLRQRKRKRQGESSNSVAAITQELLSNSGVEEVAEDLPVEVLENLLEEVPENLLEEVAENLPEEVAENLPEEVLEKSVPKPFLVDHIRQVLSAAENLQNTGRTNHAEKVTKNIFICF